MVSLGVPLVSEIDIGAARCRCPILAVTGSNGKSTLAKLCGDALRAAGYRIAVGGNFGDPLSDLAMRSAKVDWVVAEVSSFQLELATSFHPRVGVLLNLNPNHLDRHRGMAAYRQAKSRIFMNMNGRDTGIVPPGLLPVMRRLSGRGGGWVTFGAETAADVRYMPHSVTCGTGRRGGSVSIAGTYFDNAVYGITAAAAVAAVRACGASADCVARVARTFEPLGHRMTRVCEVAGVLFVDDSKATNLGAMEAGLRMCDRPVRLIAGGLLKETDLGWVKNTIAKTVRRIYLIGDAALRMERAWRRAAPCSRCRSVGQAVRHAWRDASAGETVLLSPGCASFDQFDGYEDRGTKFRESVVKISKEMES
jgi:UDP-N-acetylmuramoylalanine--D-glutamate ligase